MPTGGIIYFRKKSKIMGSRTKTILRGISILIALIIVFMQLDLITINVSLINENRMWIMIISYAMLLITLR